jgi:hypothetical protein
MNAIKYLASIVGIALLTCQTANVIAAPASPVISIASTPPQDIPGGAPAASLQAAAIFAWQEFIALNWPAKAGARDTPDTTQKFGAPGVQPLVWHTYRAKNEIFPGRNDPKWAPHGYAAGAPNYGYNDPPQYFYNPASVASKDGQVPACASQPAVTTPAWINLDEVTQITLDSMSAGVVPATSTPVNARPQLIRFMAKANFAEYAYVVQNSYWYNGKGSPRDMATSNFSKFLNNTANPVGKPFISFPTGTFEIKAAFRPLTADEKNGKRFYSTRVRYYEQEKTGLCFHEDQWGLVALHIIQKTPSAPTFIYATFEQADNLLTTVAGKSVPVEDENGNIINPSSPATTPDLTYVDDINTPKVSVVGTQSCDATADPHLFYQNSSTKTGLPGGQNICVNQRDHAIPSPVIEVNQAAHQAIAAYTKQNGIANSPWSYYKLVNVQAYPFNKTDIVSDQASPRNAATYYQANIVVETNYTLQNFDGRVADNGAPTNFNPAGKPFQNNYILNKDATLNSSYNMGGCMGCHGVAQTMGSDFSFILGAKPMRFPETPTDAMSSEKLKERFNALFHPIAPR